MKYKNDIRVDGTDVCIVCRLVLEYYISFCLAHSGHMISSASVIKPLPTRDVLQRAQMKQSLCQCLSSKDMKRVPPIPEIKNNV